MSDEKLNKEIAEESDDALQRRENATDISQSDDDEEQEHGPLSPEEFRFVLQKIDALGLTWTADIPPFVTPKEGTITGDAFTNEEYVQIKRKFPNFPYELSSVVFHALTGSKKTARDVGTWDDLQQKLAAVNEHIITTKYRAEFFFKYAIKVPYLSDLDWEVVIKAREKNVQRMPKIAYAILSLIFRQPINPTLPAEIAPELSQTEMYTVAVNDELLDKLIASLLDVKNALQQSRQVADSLSDDSFFNGGDNGELS